MERIQELYYRGLAILTTYTLSPQQLFFISSVLLIISSLFFTNDAYAGTTGDDEFSGLYDKLKSLVEGNVKNILVITSILVGIVGSIVSKSLNFIIVCFGFAISLNFIFDIGEQLSGAII